MSSRTTTTAGHRERYHHNEVGVWSGHTGFAASDIIRAVRAFRTPCAVVVDSHSGRLGVGLDGQLAPLATGDGAPCLAVLPALFPEWLGDRGFCEVHGTRFPYVTGAMARGIATARMVIEVSRAGMLGFFGSAGLSIDEVRDALVKLTRELGDRTAWGCNLIHSPDDPELEDQLVDLFLRHSVTRVSASAFMRLSKSVVRYAFSGVRVDPNGQIIRPNHVFAKVSRREVARHFMAPPPPEMLADLVQSGGLTQDEAHLANRLPVAEDITAESDSGGHTDNRPLGPLFESLSQLRQEIAGKYDLLRSIRIGAAGGLGTPHAVAGAFALGAAYVLTGSINQSAVEAGVSVRAKEMLAQADIADVTLAPSADMFELGVKVQVLKHGTLFASRATTLYELYRSYSSIDDIPKNRRDQVESQIFRHSIEEIWRDTRAFWNARSPKEVSRAESESKHKMALIFRWYLGQSSRWPIVGEPTRDVDFQLWCGPSMGAFNTWVRGSFLEPPPNRTVVQIARNLLEGAAAITRAHQLRTYGLDVPECCFRFQPRVLEDPLCESQQ